MDVTTINVQCRHIQILSRTNAVYVSCLKVSVLFLFFLFTMVETRNGSESPPFN